MALPPCRGGVLDPAMKKISVTASEIIYWFASRYLPLSNETASRRGAVSCVFMLSRAAATTAADLQQQRPVGESPL